MKGKGTPDLIEGSYVSESLLAYIIYRKFGLDIPLYRQEIDKEENRKSQTKSYFWVIRTGEDGLGPINLYNCIPTRAGANTKAFLKGMDPGFCLMVDEYQGYNVVKDMKSCCWWVHIRRYLMKAITYILNREDVLIKYPEDGRCSLSNNLCENNIHPVTL